MACGTSEELTAFCVYFNRKWAQPWKLEMWELYKWDWRVRSKKKVTALQRLRAALNLHTLMLLAVKERAVPERALVICVSLWQSIFHALQISSGRQYKVAHKANTNWEPSTKWPLMSLWVEIMNNMPTSQWHITTQTTRWSDNIFSH